MYYARCHELDKFRKDGSSAKEVEKVCGFWILKVCYSIISGPVLSMIITHNNFVWRCSLVLCISIVEIPTLIDSMLTVDL